MRDVILKKCQKRIRDLREDHDYTQTFIADILEIGQRTYADYELGKTRIPVDALVTLAKLYNVDMNYIVGLTNIPDTFPTDEIKRPFQVLCKLKKLT